jgi:hypothetical protein
MYRPKHLYYHTLDTYWNKNIIIPDEKMYGFFIMAYFCGVALVFLTFDFFFTAAP